MERLTNKREADAQRKAYETRMKQGYPRNIPEERFLRLAAYEDTGLEPEEIEQLKGEGFGLRLDKQELEQYRAIGPIDRLRELAQADREGRCVVLPAKPDQIIYQWRKGDDCLSVSRLDGVQVNADGEITYPIWNGYLIPEDFGKTVFFTRGEAALRREQDEKGGSSE